jgi:hypothetical protein
MRPATSLALIVKELELGEFHWVLMDEAGSSDDLLSYVPRSISLPYTTAAAAWSAGYLAMRSMLRSTLC